MATSDQKPWFALSVDDALFAVRSSAQGLTQLEASDRLQKFGLNRLKPPTPRSAWLRFFVQFHNVLIYVLLAAACMTAFLEHWVDTGVIVAVVIINALIGFIQEGKAERALDAIRHMLPQHAVVKRNGKNMVVNAETLVPGDVVQLQSGDKVPADLRLFWAKNLRIDEAILTGESVAVEKSTETAAENAVLGDHVGMARSGCLVTYGQGCGVVVATGDETEIGRISALLEKVESLTTPLLRQMAVFGRVLTLAIIAIAVITFGFGVWVRDYTMGDMFLAAVGLAVAAIPEGLPAILTITLAIGVQRMATRNAIIRRLPVVETLGSVTVICSDKTGTLTRNEMTVRSAVTATGMFDITGTGYDPHGGFVFEDEEVHCNDYPILEELVRASLLCNDATLRRNDDELSVQGDPTEGALLVFGLKAGLDLAFQLEQWPRTDVIPFESEHRFMATLHHDHTGHGFIYVKGAPERLLEMCSYQRMRGEDTPLDLVYWRTQMDKMAQAAQRILAIAFKSAEAEHRELTYSNVQTGLTLLGVVGIIDPPRDDAVAAVKLCQGAGIRVKMITGDHAATANAIGKQMGIGAGDHVLTGSDIDLLDELSLQRSVDRVDIFARASPEHKLRLVTALQANGHVVAMTGDGVNDAPALKRADVGIAMGRMGTEVAKEASDMVLADDNFTSIAHAVEEGRTIYDNIKKAILFILPTNGGEAFTLIAAILSGRQLPITPVQILWVNMITAVTLALALAFEPPERRVMQRPPRASAEPLLSGFFIWRILVVSLILVAGTFGLFLWERYHGVEIEYARTVAVNTLVLFEIFYLFNSRYIFAPVLNRSGLFDSPYVLYAIGVLLVFQMGFTYWAPMQKLFNIVSLDISTWVRIVAVASTVLFLVEIEKAMMRRWGEKR